MPVSRTPEHDVARRINVTIELSGCATEENPEHDVLILQVHQHVGADLRGQTNEEAGRWIKAIIDRVVRKELET